MIMFFFFFSSRRRHTRWTGDWSSDVCSSDLLARYREVADRLIASGHAYNDYLSREELEALRQQQLSKGEKPKYDGRWRPERAKALGLIAPRDAKPVVRFRTPEDGTLAWNDLVKGPIEFPNAELDDLVLLRADGVPTYNFGVVVDDLDMNITHVIRGDDHVNNTPRQVNIFQALGAELPRFAHVPMILGTDGERLSKRHGAVSVMQYQEDGYLPEALVNYLARLGWSHGDEEMFTLEQFLQWFDLAHISRSAAQFNPEKLRWLNHQYIKQRADQELGEAIRERIRRRGGDLSRGPEPKDVVKLFKDRAETLENLAEEAMIFYVEPGMASGQVEGNVVEPLRKLADLLEGVRDDDWRGETVMNAVRTVLDKYGLPLPKIAMPLRLIVFGRTKTPELGPTLAVAGKKRVLARLRERLPA